MAGRCGVQCCPNVSMFCLLSVQLSSVFTSVFFKYLGAKLVIYKGVGLNGENIFMAEFTTDIY